MGGRSVDPDGPSPRLRARLCVTVRGWHGGGLTNKDSFDQLSEAEHTRTAWLLDHAPLGLVYFAAVKLVGYTAAASFIKRRIPGSSASPWLVGGVRTVIGLGAGIGAAYGASQLGILRSEIGFYALLAPSHMCEWLILLGLFFRRPDWDWPRSLKLAALGTLWSYVLDIPAIMAVFVIPGGAWIC